MKIQLGQKVKCVVTKLEGIAVCKAEYLHGDERWDIQPEKQKDGSVPEIHTADLAQLKVVDKKRVVKARILKPVVKLGQKYRDPISTIEGIAIGRALHLNGCRRILLALEKNKDGKPEKSLWFDEPQLKLVSKKVIVKESRKTTGGPSPMKPDRIY